MCTLNWASIDCKNVSLGSFVKCRSALLHGRSYYTNAVDRDLCREFMLDVLSCDDECRGRASGFSKKLNINMGKLVSLGFELIKKPYNQTVMSQMSFVNNIWKKIVNKHDKAHSLLPILDSSIDIDKHTWFDMLGMCLLFARVSTLKRILVFRNNECVTILMKRRIDLFLLLSILMSVHVDFNACLQNLYRGFHYLTYMKLIYVSTNFRILESLKTFDCFSHKYVICFLECSNVRIRRMFVHI